VTEQVETFTAEEYDDGDVVAVVQVELSIVAYGPPETLSDEWLNDAIGQGTMSVGSWKVIREVRN